MPSAVLTYLVGSMYSPKKVVDNVSSVIVTSTLMSFITIPVIVYIALRYFIQLNKSMKNNLHVFLGATVADAAARPLHWVYDQKKIEILYKK